MKKIQILVYVVITAIILTACGSAPKTEIYTRVSEAVIKPGDAISAPTGEVVLTIVGNIEQKNSGDSLQFDMSTLESLGVVEYDVDDPFVQKNIVYSGVLISELLEVAGASPDATTLTLTALDDYSVDMKISDTVQWPFLLGLKADSEYMPIDQNGPIISIIPYNDFPELDHLTYDAVWVWSLYMITVK
jgi:hypothetical protein